MIGIGNSSRQWQSDCGGTTGQSHIVNWKANNDIKQQLQCQMILRSDQPTAATKDHNNWILPTISPSSSRASSSSIFGGEDNMICRLATVEELIVSIEYGVCIIGLLAGNDDDVAGGWCHWNCWSSLIPQHWTLSWLSALMLSQDNWRDTEEANAVNWWPKKKRRVFCVCRYVWPKASYHNTSSRGSKSSMKWSGSYIKIHI